MNIELAITISQYTLQSKSKCCGKAMNSMYHDSVAMDAKNSIEKRYLLVSTFARGVFTVDYVFFYAPYIHTENCYGGMRAHLRKHLIRVICVPVKAEKQRKCSMSWMLSSVIYAVLCCVWLFLQFSYICMFYS